MAKKRQRKRKQKQRKQSESPLRRGLHYFERRDYTRAIRAWEQAGQSESVQLALAEAHFRRALESGEDDEARRTDLLRAVEKAPSDGRYRYHLGMTYHRLECLDEASANYEQADALGFRPPGSDHLRALLAIERDVGTDLDQLAWLSPESRALLEPVSALLRHAPKAVLGPADEPKSWANRAKAAGVDEATLAFWRALAHFAAGERDAADDALRQAEGTLPAELRPLARYLRVAATPADGHLDALDELLRELAKHKQAVWPFAAELCNLVVQEASARLSVGRTEDAGSLLTLTAPVGIDADSLLTIGAIASDREAREAARRGDWSEAVRHWLWLREVLEQKGASRAERLPVHWNLAIALEQTGEWESVPEAWADTIRLLPRRRKGKTGPQETRQWMRRRASEGFKKAGDPEGVVDYCRRVVQSDPDDLDARMDLADALDAMGREIAARNEFRRILERKPDHVEARIRLGEIHLDRDEWSEAEEQFRQVIDSGHDSEHARERFAQIVIDRGGRQLQAERPLSALHIFAEGMKVLPDHPGIAYAIGTAELELEREDAARESFEVCLASGRPEMFRLVCLAWCPQENLGEVRNMLARSAAAGHDDVEFYVEIGRGCIGCAAKRDHAYDETLWRPPPGEQKLTAQWEQVGIELLDRALDKSDNDAEVFRRIIAALVPFRRDLSATYAERYADAHPDDPSAHAMLGALRGLEDDDRAARKSLAHAERLARRQGDDDLAQCIATTRDGVGTPLFSMGAHLCLATLSGDPEMMGFLGGPLGLGPLSFLDDFEDEFGDYDDFDDDEDDYW